MLYMLKMPALAPGYLFKKWRVKKIVLKNDRYPEMYLPENLDKSAYKMLRYIYWALDVKILCNQNILEKFPRQAVFYPNHLQKLDPGFVYYLLYKHFHKSTIFIAKKELEFSSMRNLYKLANVLFIDRSDLRQTLEIYEEAKKIIIKDKKYMCVFPEGTRNVTKKPLLDFKPGAFKLAYETHSPIVPTTIFNSKELNNKMRLAKTKIYVYFDEPIFPKEYLTVSTSGTAKRIQDIIANNLSNKEKIVAEIKASYKKKQ